MLELVHAFDMSFENVQDYYNSFTDKWHDLNSYAISLVDEGAKRYFDYIYEYEKNMYYLVDTDKPNYIIGFGIFDNTLILNYHKPYLNTGAIGYGIRPCERKKGYGTQLLKLLLEQCQNIGMPEVCVSAHEENIGSNKVIINNGGVFEKRFFDDDTGKYGNKYWIKLHPNCIKRIKRYKELMKKEGKYIR